MILLHLGMDTFGGLMWNIMFDVTFLAVFHREGGKDYVATLLMVLG